MKAFLTALVAAGLVLGATGAPVLAPVASGCRGQACAHGRAGGSAGGAGHAPVVPCAACPFCCPVCCAASLASPESFWVSLTSTRFLGGPDWPAGRMNDPPPLPPPRARGC